jgi:uncharacterized protein with PIN domain
VIHLTQDEFNALFAARPNVAKNADGAPTCPYCDAPLTPRTLEYWEEATDAGTDYSMGQFHCDACHRTIWRGGNWHPCVADKDDLAQLAADILADKF